MTRFGLGVLLILAAVAIMVSLPVVLGPWSVLGWWLALGVFVLGMLNCCRSIIEDF